jgi:glutamine amidotransferase
MIAIVDYGAGNLRSVRNALEFLDADVVTASVPDDLAGAEKIVLPGVGAFGAGMAALRERGFEGPLKEAVEAGTPLLGICLGLQYLFESSDEMGQHSGLGLLRGQVTRLPEEDGLKIPHIGWNSLTIQRESPLLAGIPDQAYAYFVHSYAVVADDPADVLATTDYGGPFVSVVGRGNVFGIQCHPEKSQGVGLRILKNFLEIDAA